MSSDILFRRSRLAAARNTPAVNRINDFLASEGYILLVCLLTLISNSFAAELMVYTVFLVTLAYIGLFGRDLLPTMPIIVCCYMTTSELNNPGRHASTIYSNVGVIVYLAVLLALALGCLIWRLITDKTLGSSKKPRLLGGMLILGAAYLLGGIFSPAYPDVGIKNIFFGVLQFAAIALPYLLYCKGVNWKDARKDYFCWLGFGIGCMLVGHLLWIYLTKDVIVGGSIDRDRIVTGWGMYNNIGAMLAMMIPFAFYLASRYHKGWIGTVVGTVFLIGIFMTCSRNAILFGSAGYLVCICLMLFSASNRKGNRIALLTLAVVIIVAIALFHKQLLLLFREALQRDKGFFDPNSRDSMYRSGLALFGKYPIFGTSFYPLIDLWDWASVDSFSALFPARWHSTVVQLLTCTGIVGLAAYGFHRYQTVRMFLFDRTREKAFIACSLLVLLGCSLLDCHFFNVGPVLFYSAGLAFAENCVKPKKH